MGLFSRKKKQETEKISSAQQNKSPEQDEHLIAVIAAAIAAYEGESYATTNLIIKKIDRTAGTIPAWGTAGNREQIDTRRM